MNIYAGLDVSDKMTHICALDADGNFVDSCRISASPGFPRRFCDFTALPSFASSAPKKTGSTGPVPIAQSQTSHPAAATARFAITLISAAR